MTKKAMKAPLTREEQQMLRERFNPEGSPIRRQQLRMLDMLVAIDEICRRHDIQYWLSSGTLIGAIRHDGFIPWDDDLDIEMMRGDYLRLLKLPAQIQLALRKGIIDQGHARALAGLTTPSLQLKLFDQIIKEKLSVHKVEELVKELNNGATIKSGKKSISNKGKLPSEYENLKAQLSKFFNAKVQMTCSPSGKGRISIPFNSEDDLVKIVSLFDKMKK